MKKVWQIWQTDQKVCSIFSKTCTILSVLFSLVSAYKHGWNQTSYSLIKKSVIENSVFNLATSRP